MKRNKKNEKDNYKYHFIYGSKLKIKNKGEEHHCLMKLNSDNNFILEFIHEHNLKIKKMVILPFIRNIRKYENILKIKIRMDDSKDSFYLYFKTLDEFEKNLLYLSLLIKEARSYRYQLFNWKNLCYLILYKFKIYNKKAKIYKIKHVKKLFKKLNINVGYFDWDINSNKKIRINTSKILGDNQDLNLFSRIFVFIQNELIENKNQLGLISLIKIIFLLLKENNLKNLFDFLIENDDYKKLNIKKIFQNKQNTIKKELKIKKFYKYLSNFEKEELPLQKIKKIQNFFNEIRSKDIFHKKTVQITKITFEEFSMYNYSKLNYATNPKKTKLYQNMNHPLSHYYILSSHNTYLTGNQIYGQAGVEGYLRAIERGYRCMEIDCWDGKNGEPVVTHGNTLVQKCDLKDVIFGLSKYAFRHNNFPLILSFEMHCCAAQRDKVAEYVYLYFKDRLFIPDCESVMKVYSPRDLLGKVLIKNSVPYPREFGVKESGGIVFKFKDDNLARLSALFKEKFPLKDLKDEDNVMEFSTPFGVCSFNSSKLSNLVKTKEEIKKMSCFTSRHFLRIYPNGMNINSGNYNPIIFWNFGCQMVSLNLQKKDEHLLINMVFFKQNGGKKCGYVLKPKNLWGVKNNYSTLLKVILKFNILSSQLFFGKEIAQNDDVLQIYTISHNENNASNKFSIKLKKNFFHPIIEENDFEFEIKEPKKYFIIFKIFRKNNLKSIGAIPVNLIRNGLRVVRIYENDLFNNHFSYLLLHINVEKIYNTDN